MVSSMSKIVSIIFNSIVKEVVIKPISNEMQAHRVSTNRNLGYDGVNRHIERSSKHIRYALLHLVIFIIVIVVLKLLAGTNPYSTANIYLILGGMLWTILVLVPHMGAALLYANRWSSKELETVEKSNPKPTHKQREFPDLRLKPKRRSDFNFSKDWDE